MTVSKPSRRSLGRKQVVVRNLELVCSASPLILTWGQCCFPRVSTSWLEASQPEKRFAGSGDMVTAQVAEDSLAGALDLPEHGMRLQFPLLVGLVVDPLVPTKSLRSPPP